MKKLTKHDILEGTRKRETLFVKEYNAEVVIRPLTDGEISAIFALVAPAGSVEGASAIQDGTSKFEGTELQKNFEALRLATSMGLEDPKLSPEEVSKMKFGVPEEIGSHVLKISGVVMSNDEIKKKGKKYKN
jgi:hypothetical protein